MGLAEVRDAGAAQAEFPGADEGAVDGDGIVDAGVADVGVVEEVVDAGLEGVGVEEPAAEGDLHAELMLFVAFAVERREVGVVGLGELHDGAGGGEEWRGLVEVPVEAAKDPVEFRDLDGCADARGGYVFGDLGLEVGLAQAEDEG